MFYFFRLTLDQFETDVSLLETHLDKVKLWFKSVFFSFWSPDLLSVYLKHALLTFPTLNLHLLLDGQSLCSLSLTNQVMKLCGKMVEAGQAYNAANQLFLSGLAELLLYQKKESVMMVRSCGAIAAGLISWDGFLYVTSCFLLHRAA